MGRLMNCMVVIECCVIVYFSFVLSDTPMDVLCRGSKAEGDDGGLPTSHAAHVMLDLGTGDRANSKESDHLEMGRSIFFHSMMRNRRNQVLLLDIKSLVVNADS